MELKILWMYSDMMDLYGDKGNVQVLKMRCQRRGIDCTVDTMTMGDTVSLEDYDLLFMGGGADFEQNLLYKDLLDRREGLQKALDSGSAFFLVCGSYQLFGQYYLDQDGNKVEGLGLYDFYTIASTRDRRCIGNIAVQAQMDGCTFKAVGFENHGGQTQNVATPFAKVLKGHGNTYDGGYEGFLNNQVLATYMHGSLLPKNPLVADLLLKRALRRNYGTVELAPLDDSLEDHARKIMLERMGIKE